MGKTKQILSSLVILASSSASASTAAVTSNDAAHHHQQTTEHHHIATHKEIPSHEHKKNNHHHHRKLGKAGKAETTTTYTQQISSAANGSGNYGWWPSATEPPVPPPPPPQMGVGWQQPPPPQWGQPQPQPVEPVHHGQNGGHTGPHWTAISTTGGKSGKKTSVSGKAGKKLDSWSWGGAEATESSGAWWEGSSHPSISSKSSKSSKSTKHSKSAEEEWGGGWSWPTTIGDMDPSSQDANEDGDDDDDEEEEGGGLLTTVVDVALENPDFSTLVTALTAANLVEALSGVGPFTVFAPTNEAFAALPEGTLDTLLSPENIDQLSNILRYHVVSGNFPSSTLTTSPVETLLNGPLADIIVDGMNVMVNDAHVILPDIIADNGVVHVIDKVLLPPPPENMSSRYSSLSSGSSSSTTSTTSQSSSVSKPNGGQASSSSSSSSWWGAAGSSSSSSSSWWGAATTSGSKGGKTSGGWTTNPHVHHGPHPGVGAAAWHPSPKSGKTSKSSKSKSAKAYYHVAGGNTGWSTGHGSGSKDTVSMGDDWWGGGSSKGPEEDMGDDWWGGPCPPGKAGKNCDVDAAVPSAEPTPCGKAGKDDCDHLEEDEEEVEDFLEEEVEDDGSDGMVDELVESFTNRNPAGGNTIGDLIPITPKPSLSPSPPPSSSWPTWTPTALPTTAVDALRSGSGTWFQSGRAYDVEMSHYRVESLNQNGEVQGKAMDNAAGRSSRWSSSWGVMVMSGAGIVMSYLTMMLLE